jgi:septum formation protein
MLFGTDYRLILASQSPRRSSLLEAAGIPFEVKAMPIDEIFPEDMPASEVAPYLARQKALAAGPLLETPRDVLLTADSVVILDGEIFGKPTDYEDAVRILSRLSGRAHEVITGVCLRSLDREEVFADLSLVHVLPLSRAEIDYYIERCRPFDKAGAYAIQEWIGLCKISRIEGSHANIMGLPVHRVYEALRAFVTA